MGHIISIVSLKGGVGKTTTAVNLSTSLAMVGKKTLLVDCDPQGSATTGIGIDKSRLKKTLYDALIGKYPPEEIVIRAKPDLLDAIPVRGELFRTEYELMSHPDKERILSELLPRMKHTYDFIIIDTPPSLGLIAINGIVAADSLLIPLQCEYLAYESLVQLLRFINLVKRKLNPNLQLTGVLLTMHEKGEQVSDRIVENVKERLKNKAFDTIIPRNVRIRESAATGKPLPLDDPESVGAQCHMRLAAEVMDRTANHGIVHLF